MSEFNVSDIPIVVVAVILLVKLVVDSVAKLNVRRGGEAPPVSELLSQVASDVAALKATNDMQAERIKLFWDKDWRELVRKIDHISDEVDDHSSRIVALEVAMRLRHVNGVE